MKSLRELLCSESGATLVEYALLLGLIAALAIGIGQSFGGALSGMYRRIAATLAGA